MSSPLGALLLLGLLNTTPREKKVVDRGFAGLCVVFFMLVGLVCGGLGGWTAGDKRVREEAVERNLAKYEADPKTGKVSFVWKD